MAGEVFDIVHRLTYEANVSPVDKATAAIENEVNAINQLQQSVTRLEGLRARTDKANLERINQINAAIDNRNRRIQTEIGLIQRQVQNNERLRNELRKGGDQLVSLGNQLARTSAIAGRSSMAFIDLGRILQDLPFGIIGIANNLVPALQSLQALRVEAAATGVTLRTALISSLTGPAGLVLALSAVTAGLTFYSLSAQGAGKETETLEEKIKSATKSLEDMLEALNETKDLPTLFSSPAIKNLERELELLRAKGDQEDKIFQKEKQLRKEQISDLQRQDDAYGRLRNIGRNTEDVRGQVSEALPFASPQEVTRVTNAILNGLNVSELAIRKQNEIREKIRDLQNDDVIEQEQYNREAGERRKKAYDEAYQRAIQEVENTLNENLLKDKTLQYIDALISTEQEILNLRRQNRAADGVSLTEEELKSEQKEVDFNISRLEAARKVNELLLKISAEKEKAAIAERNGNNADAVRYQLQVQELTGQLVDARSNIPRTFIDPISDRPSTAIPPPKLSGSSRSKDEIADLVTPDKDKVKERLDDVVTVYRSFEQSIGQILNDISERQIRALDQEVQIRTERVRQAERLAERGNTEILRLETERLEESEKLRREAAQRQIAINSALALSNAIVAVATTAAESGVASIATIPAVLAALVAGYSFVRSLDQGTGFKDGVIDLKGPGTERSDSIPARLSKGESVMTAQATRRYKPLLEAMNEGKLPYTANKPFLSGNDKITAKKLDQIIEAIEGNQVNVKQSMDQYGIAQSVETAQRRERRKWS